MSLSLVTERQCTAKPRVPDSSYCVFVNYFYKKPCCFFPTLTHCGLCRNITFQVMLNCVTSFPAVFSFIKQHKLLKHDIKCTLSMLNTVFSQFIHLYFLKYFLPPATQSSGKRIFYHLFTGSGWLEPTYLEPVSVMRPVNYRADTLKTPTDNDSHSVFFFFFTAGNLDIHAVRKKGLATVHPRKKILLLKNTMFLLLLNLSLTNILKILLYINLLVSIVIFVVALTQ